MNPSNVFVRQQTKKSFHILSGRKSSFMTYENYMKFRFQCSYHSHSFDNYLWLLLCYKVIATETLQHLLCGLQKKKLADTKDC